MRRWAALGTLLLGTAAALADETVEDLLFKARHAHLVRGDLRDAVGLYRKALENKSLGAGRQAEIHLRIALCYETLKEYRLALDPHLKPHIYEGDAVAEEIRDAADAARGRIEPRLPREAQPERPGRVDPDALRAERLRYYVREARRALDSDQDVVAWLSVQQALEIDPKNAEARALGAEVNARLSGLTEFFRSPLDFLQLWAEQRTAVVAREAGKLLQEALSHGKRGKFNLAEARFGEAVALIDANEFVRQSDRLLTLRHRIVARWSALRSARLGPDHAAPPIPAAAARDTVLGDYLKVLQRLLDLVSEPGREYRLVPVQAPRAAAPRGWDAKPRDYALARDLSSTWSPALFARDYLPRRVHPESWSRRGNYLEAAGGMLVARNSPKVLDAVHEQVKQLALPATESLPGRFLLVPVPRDALGRFAQEFGEFSLSHRGKTPVQLRVIPQERSLDYLCDFLRDQGADVRLAHDTFAVQIRNGVPQTLFAGLPLNTAPGYETFKPAGAPITQTHYGVLLDLYPLQDQTGRTALGLRLTSRLPAPKLLGAAGGAVTPRFLTQDAELFVDLPAGATLVIAGLIDPFAAARGRGRADQELLILFQAGGARVHTEATPAAPGPIGAEVSLRNLLLKVRDDPGPRRDAERGFVPREQVDVLTARARFLEELLRNELDSKDVKVRVDEAVVEVPPALRADAAAIVGALERESARSYVVRIQTRAVQTSVLDRWQAREKLEPRAFDEALVALTDDPGGELLLRNLDPVEPGDVFAPVWEWPKPAALGLQARHALSATTRTSPTYTTDADLASGATRTVSEGTRIAVRPFAWRGRLQAHVVIETAGLQSEVEEHALGLEVPSYRTRVTGTHVAGLIDLGNIARPRTALIRGIPHPKTSRPDRLTEIVVVLTVRYVP